MIRIAMLLSALLYLSPGGWAQSGNPFEHLDAHRSTDSVLLSYMETDRHEVQLAFAYVNKKEELVRHTYGPVNETYFYPASTVKMVVAALALEKLNGLGIEELTAEAPMQTFAGRSVQTAAFLDGESPSGFRTVDEYIHQIFIASDNEAYNRLYEFVGVDYINRRLKEMGYEARIVHRLSAPEYDEQENLYTNPVRFYSSSGKILYHQGLVKSSGESINRLHDLPGQRKGKAFYDGEQERTIPLAFDFSHKNAIGLRDLQDFLMAITMPDLVSERQQIHLSDDDRIRLWRHMSSWPHESHRTDYQKLPADYVKFFLTSPADTARLRIYNKVGYAYGTLTDVSYIVDSETEISYFLAATILVNENGIFNDNVYEYEEEGRIFLSALSQYIRLWIESEGLRTAKNSGIKKLRKGQRQKRTN
jgi:hypothetical protein